MASKLTVEELIVHVKKLMPASKLILNMETLSKSEGIRFKWHKKEFVVLTNLLTCELKNGKDLYKTGMSSLIQNILASNSNTNKLIVEIMEELEEAEKKIAKGQVSKSVSSLEKVKTIISRLIRA
jgi:hypothetical protein